MPGKIAPLQTLVSVTDEMRRRGGRLVCTGGCFDILHAGHVRYLAEARSYGDALIVLLNDDSSVRRLKGADRPIVSQEDRAEVLSALAAVDYVCLFGEDTPVAALELLRPDVFVKGGDYAGTRIPEAEALASWGGRVVYASFAAGRSSTSIIDRIKNRKGTAT